MTTKIKYPAWWPENSIHNDDPTGMNAKPFDDIRAIDNDNIRDLLTDKLNGGRGNPADSFDLLDPDLSLKDNINSAVVVAMQILRITFSATGVTVGVVEEDAFKKFLWADIFERAFSDEELDIYEGEGPLPQLYDLLISTAERIRAEMEAWDE